MMIGEQIHLRNVIIDLETGHDDKQTQHIG